MSEYKYLDRFPQPLKESIVQNRCLPIIGSGFSKNAEIPKGHSMPDWVGLGRAFADEMDAYKYSSTIDAISAYEHAYSRPIMAEQMKKFLLSGQVKPGMAHEAFCRLQFDIVCTTNFDHLLEDGYRKISKPCRAIISESQLSIAPMKDELTLLKFHGDIDHPDKMVATEEDYDKFIDQNPMLATYLSNLLITRTPLFIGYSLDDDDFRQIWQIIKSRLGKMVRQAYVVIVNCSEAERARYERRGVKVVNIEGDVKDYSQILTELFNEIKSYWDDNVKTIGDNSSLSELALPKGSQTRLCFFTAPIMSMSYYKDVFFPIALKYGFIPITADAVISNSDNWMAKVSSLISKIDYFVVDLSTQNTLYEFIQISSMNKVKENILVIKDEGYIIPIKNSYQVITKEKDFFEKPEQYITKVENWFKKLSDKVDKKSLDEPNRLLRKNEYNAAVISAVIQLEVKLRKLIKGITGDRVFARGFLELTKIAVSNRIIKEDDMEKLRQWSYVRNQLVHSEMNLDELQAISLVNEITSYTEGVKDR